MITTTNGVTIRMNIDQLRVMGRATSGVRLIRLDDGDAIADVTVVKKMIQLMKLLISCLLNQKIQLKG